VSRGSRERQLVNATIARVTGEAAAVTGFSERQCSLRPDPKE
jgi:hypothetical protein